MKCMGRNGMADPRWDGVEEIWFDDYDAARRAIDSIEYQRSFLPDFARFSEPPWHFFAETALLMWPGKTVDEVRREIARKVAAALARLINDGIAAVGAWGADVVAKFCRAATKPA